MSAFSSLIALIIIAALSMAAVAYTNYLEDKRKKTSLRLEKLKFRVEELEDMVLTLDGLCEERTIPRLVNDEIVELYEIMVQIDPKAAHISAGLSNAKMRSDELLDESSYRHISRVCKSDAQIARHKSYLGEALVILKKQHAEGKITANEVQHFTLSIEWLQLQVGVISNIIQGHKAYNKHDVLTANAFYKKAQNELMKSSHPDERRHKMISQLADVLFGRRKSLDQELMPETECNPDIEPSEEELALLAANSEDSESTTVPHQ